VADGKDLDFAGRRLETERQRLAFVTDEDRRLPLERNCCFAQFAGQGFARDEFERICFDRVMNLYRPGE
jgi:hypothetical protein